MLVPVGIIQYLNTHRTLVEDLGRPLTSAERSSVGRALVNQRKVNATTRNARHGRYGTRLRAEAYLGRPLSVEEKARIKKVLLRKRDQHRTSRLMARDAIKAVGGTRHRILRAVKGRALNPAERAKLGSALVERRRFHTATRAASHKAKAVLKDLQDFSSWSSDFVKNLSSTPSSNAAKMPLQAAASTNTISKTAKLTRGAKLGLAGLGVAGAGAGTIALLRARAGRSKKNYNMQEPRIEMYFSVGH